MKVEGHSKLADRLSILIAIILCLLPFHALLATWIGSNTGHLDLIRIWKELLLVFVLTPAGLWLVWRSGPLRRWFLTSKIMWLFAAYELLSIGLGLWAVSRHQLDATALIYALIINLRFIAFFLICAAVASQSTVLRTHWLRIVLIPAAVVVVFGLIQQFILPTDFLKHFGYGPATIPAYQTVDSDINYQRIQSTLRGANPLGAYLVLIVPVAVLALRRRLRLAMGGGSILALFYSYSRSAWIGAFAAVMFLVTWKMKGTRRLKEVLAACLIVILLAGIGAYSFRSNHTAENTIFHTNSSSTTGSPNTKHAAAVKQGFKDVVHQPQGRGPGTAGPASFRNSGHAPRIAEDYYLQIGQEVGVLGLLIFVAINILVVAGLWARRHDTLAQVLLASLAGISFINLVSHAWTDDTLSLLWWGLAGIACAPVILTGRYKANGKTKKTAA